MDTNTIPVTPIASIESNWENLYKKDPKVTIEALWTGFRSTQQKGSIEEFAQYLLSQYPDVSDLITEDTESEFAIKIGKDIVARELHRKILKLHSDDPNRREFMGRGIGGLIAYVGKEAFGLFGDTTSAVQRLLAEKW